MNAAFYKSAGKSATSSATSTVFQRRSSNLQKEKVFFKLFFVSEKNKGEMIYNLNHDHPINRQATE